MTPLDPGYMPEEFQRHLAEQRARMQEAQRLVRYAHSRSGLLAASSNAWPTRSTPRARRVETPAEPGRGAVYLIPAAARPAEWAPAASDPASSARTAAVAKAWARCWSMLRSMFASENHAQYVWSACRTWAGGLAIAAVAH
jgi:hypothetical protein